MISSNDQKASRVKMAIFYSVKDKSINQENKVEENQVNNVDDYKQQIIQNESNTNQQEIYFKNDFNEENIHQNAEMEINLLGPSSEIHMESYRIIEDKLSYKEKSENSLLIKKEGLLQKKSPHLLQGWQDRYVILENKILKYYTPNDIIIKDNQITLKNSVKPYGTLNFDLVYFEIKPTKDKHEFKIKPGGGQKSFHFRATSADEAQKWFHTLHSSILQSQGFYRKLTGLSSYYRFWRTDRISAEQFSEYSNTGDILLFRGQSVNARVQRFFTGSDYDHVGLVLRYQSGTIYIFEATGNFGVGLCSWKNMIEKQWYKFFDKLVLRRLIVKRDAMFLEKISEFIEQNLGKKFSCAINKLLRQRSSIVDLGNELKKNKNTKKDRTYFCSELVAACYKHIGIIEDKERSTSNYWPGSFSNDKEDIRLKNASLKPEELIDFSSLQK